MMQKNGVHGHCHYWLTLSIELHAINPSCKSKKCAKQLHLIGVSLEIMPIRIGNKEIRRINKGWAGYSLAKAGTAYGATLMPHQSVDASRTSLMMRHDVTEYQDCKGGVLRKPAQRRTPTG